MWQPESSPLAHHSRDSPVNGSLGHGIGLPRAYHLNEPASSSNAIKLSEVQSMLASKEAVEAAAVLREAVKGCREFDNSELNAIWETLYRVLTYKYCPGYRKATSAEENLEKVINGDWPVPPIRKEPSGAEASEPESKPEFVEEAEEEKDVEVRSGEPPGLDNIFEFLTEMATRLEDLSATQKEERVPRKKEKQERMERMARMEKSGKAAKERPKRAPSNLLNLMSRRVSAPDKEERSSCLRGVVGLGECSDCKRMARREKEGRRWK